MRCAHCGHETPADSAFCIACGHTLPPRSRSPRRRLRTGLALGLAALLFLAVVAAMVVRTVSPHLRRDRPPAQPAAGPTVPSATVDKGAEPPARETPAAAETDRFAARVFTADCFSVRKPSGWVLAKSSTVRCERNFVATRKLPGADTLRLTIDAFDLPWDMTLADFYRWTLSWAQPKGTRLVGDPGERAFKGVLARHVVARGEQTETAVCFLVRGDLGFIISTTAPVGRLKAHQAAFDEALDTFKFIDRGAPGRPGSLQPQIISTAVYTLAKPAGWRHQEQPSTEGGSQFSAIKELEDRGELRLYIGVSDVAPGASLAAFSDERLGSVQGLRLVEDTTNFVFADEPARRVLLRSDKGDLMWYFLLRKGKGVAICMEAPAGTFTDHQEDFDEVLRTFRLAETASGTKAPSGGPRPAKGS